MKRVKVLFLSFVAIFILAMGVSCSKTNPMLDNSDANVKVEYNESAASAVEEIVDFIPEGIELSSEKILEMCKTAKIPQEKLLNVCNYIKENGAKVSTIVMLYIDYPSNEEYAGAVYDLYKEISTIVGTTTVGRVIYVSACATLEEMGKLNTTEGKIATNYLKKLEKIDIEYFASASKIIIGWLDQEMDKEVFVALSKYLVTTSLEDLLALEAVAKEVKYTSDELKFLLELTNKLTIEAMDEELFKLMYPAATAKDIENFNKTMFFSKVVYEVTYNEIETLITISNASAAIEEKIINATSYKDYCNVLFYVYDDVLSNKQAKNLCSDLDKVLKALNTMLEGSVPTLPIEPTKKINSAEELISTLKEAVNANDFTEMKFLEHAMNYLATVAPNVFTSLMPFGIN